MDKIITIERFDGGISDDFLSGVFNQFVLTKHFDLSKPNRLIPYRSMEANSASLADNRLSSFIYLKDSAGTSKFFALGRKSSSSNNAKIFEKTNITDDFAASTTGEGASGSVCHGTGLGFKGKVFFEWESGSDCYVGSYDPATDTYTSTVGTITGGANSTIQAKPFWHPKSDLALFAGKNIMATYDGTTFRAAALTLPSDVVITSITDYGNYAAISVKPSAYGVSRVFLWDMVTPDVIESIEFGEGSLEVIENVEGYIVGVSSTAGTALNIKPELSIRVYGGGSAQLIKKIRAETTTLSLYRFHSKQGSRLFFPVSMTYSGSAQHQLMVVGRNSTGGFYTSFDRLLNNDTTLTGVVEGFDILGDYLIAAFDSGTVMQTNDQATFSATSIYETQKFKSFSDSTLVSAKLLLSNQSTGGTVVLKYRKDDETTWTQILTDSTDNIIERSAENVESRAFTATMTIASPCVVTATNHGLAENQPIVFTTSDTLPTGITSGTVYYVLGSALTANTFTFSDSPSGTAINTSGSQNGTHTITTQSFSFPSFNTLQFRVESTGGTEILGLQFRYSVLQSLLT